jgi:hypothetical protein
MVLWTYLFSTAREAVAAIERNDEHDWAAIEAGDIWGSSIFHRDAIPVGNDSNVSTYARCLFIADSTFVVSYDSESGKWDKGSREIFHVVSSSMQ